MGKGLFGTLWEIAKFFIKLFAIIFIIAFESVDDAL